VGTGAEPSENTLDSSTADDEQVSREFPLGRLPPRPGPASAPFPGRGPLAAGPAAPRVSGPRVPSPYFAGLETEPALDQVEFDDTYPAPEPTVLGTVR